MPSPWPGWARSSRPSPRAPSTAVPCPRNRVVSRR
jgi:hypothetical protein